MQVWNVLHAARRKYRTQKKSPKIAIWDYHTTLSGYIFATKAGIDNRKKNLLSSNMSSTCPHIMVNFSPVTAEIGSGVWGTRANFNRFCVLAALLHGSQVVSVSQTLRCWTEGATYVRQGDHHAGRWAHILVFLSCFFLLLMVALSNRADHYIFILWFLLSFFSSPNLSGRRLDVCHTSTNGVALVPI